MKGQPEIIIANNHLKYNGFCIEVKSPTDNYQISDEHLKLENDYEYTISND